MTSTEHLWAWVFYAVGSAMAYGLLWYWTRNWRWREVTIILRVICAVFLIVPWQTDTETSFLSPAWIISAADALQYGGQAFWRAGMALVLSLVGALILSTIYLIVQWYRYKNQVE